jgi:hypothetical protein
MKKEKRTERTAIRMKKSIKKMMENARGSMSEADYLESLIMRDALKADVVISTSDHFVQFLEQIGVLSENYELYSRVESAEQVEGKVIAGNLPLRLCAAASGVIQVDLKTKGKRLDRMSLDDLLESEYKIESYKVQKIR